MKIAEKLQQVAADGINSLYGASILPKEILVNETRKEFTGDLTIVVFSLLKASGKSLPETAESLGKYIIINLEEAESFEIVKGFLNIRFKDYVWIDTVAENHQVQTGKGKKVMVEYSSPNTNKPLHLGHIRNNLLGFSVTEILKAAGYEVIKANLINDRGIHICKSMLAWIKWGEEETPESGGMKGDHLVGKYYVLFDKKLKEQTAGMEEGEAKKAPLMLEAQEMLQKWEANDPETKRIWSMMNAWVYDGFKVTYKSLGVDFDKFYYESETYLLGKTIVQKGLEKNVFFKKDDGSVWIDLKDEGLDEKLVLRADGTSVYITQDLGTANVRFEEYDLHELVYVVADEQDYHFKVLQKIAKKLGEDWWQKLHHLNYGMVDLPSGKMKSREGTVVDADDLIEEMLETAKQTTLELGKTTDMNPGEQSELFRKIGMAALKFFILRTDPRKRMTFDPKESIDFQGFTGPFIQYTYARIRSIFRKANLTNIPSPTHQILNNEERELLKLLAVADDKLTEAAYEKSPAVIAHYVYEIAKIYNKFYHDCPVLTEPDEARKNFRLWLSERAAIHIKQNLSLLGIEAVEQM